MFQQAIGSFIWSIKRIPEITSHCLFLFLWRCSGGGGPSFCPRCVHAWPHADSKLHKNPPHAEPHEKAPLRHQEWLWDALTSSRASHHFSPRFHQSMFLSTVSCCLFGWRRRRSLDGKGCNVASGRRGFILGTNWDLKWRDKWISELLKTSTNDVEELWWQLEMGIKCQNDYTVVLMLHMRSCDALSWSLYILTLKQGGQCKFTDHQENQCQLKALKDIFISALIMHINIYYWRIWIINEEHSCC